MKHVKLLPLLIAAAFMMARAHALDGFSIGTLSGLSGDWSGATAGALEHAGAGKLPGGQS